MFIIPFIHNIIKQHFFHVNVIKILTIGGQELWEENNNLNLDKDILNPNDIYRKTKKIKLDKNTIACEVDIEKTKIADFYNWEEIDVNNKDIFCWRTFIYLTDVKGINWLEIPQKETLSNMKIKDIIETIIKN